MSNLKPFEYAIFSKEEFMEPKRGNGVYNGRATTWAKYNLRLHEYVTMNEANGEKISDKPNTVCAYFCYSETIDKELEKLPLGAKIKFTQAAPLAGRRVGSYRITKVDAVAPNATPASTTAGQTAEQFIAAHKKAGTPLDQVLILATKNYDITIEMVRQLYGAY